MKRKVYMHIEGVPNPNAIKFVLENGILAEKPYEFDDPMKAEASPLAKKILMFRYVESVLINRNFITVRKLADASIAWNEVLFELKSLIQQHLESNEPILIIGAKAITHERSEDVIVELVTDILDKRIRPAAQEDGGDILFEGYENGIVNLRVHGSCHTCPYISQTVSQGVEPLLRSALPEIRAIHVGGKPVS